MEGKEKIILPLDVDCAEKAAELVKLLKDDVGAFKVGLELVNSVGFGIFDRIEKVGAEKIFYDGKFHDIPTTVAGASRAATRRGHWMYNVHCSGSVAMMKAAKDVSVEVASKFGWQLPLVIGVTLLTSVEYSDLEKLGLASTLLAQYGETSRSIASDTYKLKPDELLKQECVQEIVVKMSKAAKEAGLDGVVASPHEIEMIKKACGDDFLVVTPGVRPAGSDVNDQKRVMTPGEAIERGADYLVIGRPITSADDPAQAAKSIAAEIDEALVKRQKPT